MCVVFLRLFRIVVAVHLEEVQDVVEGQWISTIIKINRKHSSNLFQAANVQTPLTFHIVYKIVAQIKGPHQMMHHKNQTIHQMPYLQLNSHQSHHKPVRIRQMVVVIQQILYRALVNHRADHQLQKVSCVGVAADTFRSDKNETWSFEPFSFDVFVAFGCCRNNNRL